MSWRRVGAVSRKELLEYKRNGNMFFYAIAVLPLIFIIQPLVQVFTLSSRASVALHHEHSLIYLLAIPVLVPAALAAYSVVGERTQGTLEPVLATPVRKEELLLGKALAAFVPSVVVAYLVFALYVAVVELFARPGVASALVQGPELLVQLAFTPLLATWSIWVGISLSARCSDPRTAQQFSILASLPAVAVTSLVAFNVIPANLKVALAFGIGLVVLTRLGWRVASALFDRERLTTGTN
jgi:ABC-type transport system involved in multi-copper enzyme maturation permease subunit